MIEHVAIGKNNTGGARGVSDTGLCKCIVGPLALAGTHFTVFFNASSCVMAVQLYAVGGLHKLKYSWSLFLSIGCK